MAQSRQWWDDKMYLLSDILGKEVAHFLHQSLNFRDGGIILQESVNILHDNLTHTTQFITSNCSHRRLTWHCKEDEEQNAEHNAQKWKHKDWKLIFQLTPGFSTLAQSEGCADLSRIQFLSQESDNSIHVLLNESIALVLNGLREKGANFLKGFLDLLLQKSLQSKSPQLLEALANSAGTYLSGVVLEQTVNLTHDKLTNHTCSRLFDCDFLGNSMFLRGERADGIDRVHFVGFGQEGRAQAEGCAAGLGVLGPKKKNDLAQSSKERVQVSLRGTHQLIGQEFKHHRAIGIHSSVTLEMLHMDHPYMYHYVKKWEIIMEEGAEHSQHLSMIQVWHKSDSSKIPQPQPVKP